MGLAGILPPRLERELREVRDYLVGEGSLEGCTPPRMGKRTKHAPTKKL